MIESHTFTSINPGYNTLVIGSIHGNEHCGSIAIDKQLSSFHAGTLNIISGSVTMIPRANKEAFIKNTRQVEYNLNRIFGPREIISNEHRIAKLIEYYIKKSDFILDLHSTHTDDGPFIFQDSSHPVSHCFTKQSPFSDVLLNWPALYSNSPDIDSIAYASSQGIPGVTVECGNHYHPDSVENATIAINNMLRYFGNIQNTDNEIVSIPKNLVTMEKIVHRPQGAQFIKKWKNFDSIEKGEVIGTSKEGVYLAPYDGYIILPKPNGEIGDEWYYLGTRPIKN